MVSGSMGADVGRGGAVKVVSGGGGCGLVVMMGEGWLIGRSSFTVKRT